MNIFGFLFGKRIKKKTSNFFELSSKEKKRIIKKAGIAAQKEQKKILHEYEVRFGNSKTNFVSN